MILNRPVVDVLQRPCLPRSKLCWRDALWAGQTEPSNMEFDTNNCPARHRTCHGVNVHGTAMTRKLKNPICCPGGDSFESFSQDVNFYVSLKCHCCLVPRDAILTHGAAVQTFMQGETIEMGEEP